MPRGAPPRSSLSLTALRVVSMRATVPVTLLAVQTPSSAAAIASTPGSTGIWRGSARRAGIDRHTEPLKLSVNQTPPAPTASAPSDRPGTRTPASIRPSARVQPDQVLGARPPRRRLDQHPDLAVARRDAHRGEAAHRVHVAGDGIDPVQPARAPDRPYAAGARGDELRRRARRHARAGRERLGGDRRARGGVEPVDPRRRRHGPQVAAPGDEPRRLLPSGDVERDRVRGLGPHDVRAQIHARHRVLVRVHGPHRARADRDRRRRRAHRRPPDDLGRARVDRDDGARRRLDGARRRRIRVAARADRDARARRRPRRPDAAATAATTCALAARTPSTAPAATCRGRRARGPGRAPPARAAAAPAPARSPARRPDGARVSR